MNINKLIIVSIFTVLAGCGNNALTEAQSEVASYCLVMMTEADTLESIQLVPLISSHMDERGFDKKEVEKGALRAAEELEGSDKKKVAMGKIKECREVIEY